MSKDNKNLLKIIIFGILFYFLCLNFSHILKIVLYVVSVLMPVIAGIFITFIMNIPVKATEKIMGKRIKRSRVPAIIISYIIVTLIITVLAFMVAPQIQDSVIKIKNSIPRLIENMAEISKKLEKNYMTGTYFEDFFKENKFNINDLLSKFKDYSIEGLINYDNLKSAFSFTNSIFNGFITFGIGFIFSFYFLYNKEKLLKQFDMILHAFVAEDIINGIHHVGELSQNVFEGFIIGKTKEAFILTGMFYILMKIFSIPAELSISVMEGLLSYLPIVGAFLGSIIGTLIILIESPVKAAEFLILSILIQQVESNIIYPKVVGKSVGLPGVWVLFSITVFGSIAGFFGMLVCVPIASIIYTIIKEQTYKNLNKKNKETGSNSKLIEKPKNSQTQHNVEI